MIRPIATSRSSPPLKWHGGKHYLANRIIALFPAHVHYVEPYFGGGAVLLAKPDEFVEGHSEVVNDLNGDLANFWSVLRDETSFTAFQRIVEATPMSKPVWEAAFRQTGESSLDKATLGTTAAVHGWAGVDLAPQNPTPPRRFGP